MVAGKYEFQEHQVARTNVSTYLWHVGEAPIIVSADYPSCFLGIIGQVSRLRSQIVSSRLLDSFQDGSVLPRIPDQDQHNAVQRQQTTLKGRGERSIDTSAKGQLAAKL